MVPGVDRGAGGDGLGAGGVGLLRGAPPERAVRPDLVVVGPEPVEQRIDNPGVITLRHNSRLHHIGLGRRHARTRVLVLVRDRHIRVLTTDGQLLRELHFDPTRDYPRRKRERCRETPVHDVPRHHNRWDDSV